MRVQKRNGQLENVHFDKITTRIARLCARSSTDLALRPLAAVVDPILIARDTIKNIYDKVHTAELDMISANISESMKLTHPDYGVLAARILVSNLHKATPATFSASAREIKRRVGILSDDHYTFICANAAALDAMIDNTADYQLDYVGYKTMEKSYLVTASSEIIDRPQYIYMRVAVAIYMTAINPLPQIQQCYNELSQLYYTHATPTLFNSCAKMQQLNSCFLSGSHDSIEGIMGNLTDMSIISKWAGGIGIWMHGIRSRGQHIRGTNGRSSGLVPQLVMYAAASRTWDQGGKRKGAFAIYLEPWHGDIQKVLEMKLNQGNESERARDLFYAMWIPDLFVHRVMEDKPWSLFSEDTAPGLSDVYDGMEVCTKCGAVPSDRDTEECQHEYARRDVFTELYCRYEQEGRAVKVVPAREIMDAICESQRESGNPYICFKDHVNRQSAQSGIGTVKSSNLCAEIMEVSTATSYACCTLASVNLKKFLRDDGTIDHPLLHSVVRSVTRNLDRVIDVNAYPIDKCRGSSRDYRPIGIGVQGLADLFAAMRVPFLSSQAEQVDVEIMETMYHAALTESCARAAAIGRHVDYEYSPAARGLLHFDLWAETQRRINSPLAGTTVHSGRYDWAALKADIAQHGLRNSLHIALMPTVSTSQIMGNNESFEPFNGNIYTKNTLGGKYTMANLAMIEHLIELGLWSAQMKEKIISAEGSVKDIAEIPADVRAIYATIWEIPQRELMRRAALRGAFVDQSQSLNIYVRNNSNATLRGIFFTGWRLGLKTGSYYVRTRAAGRAMRNNILAVADAGLAIKTALPEVCPADCDSCSA